MEIFYNDSNLNKKFKELAIYNMLDDWIKYFSFTENLNKINNYKNEDIKQYLNLIINIKNSSNDKRLNKIINKQLKKYNAKL